MGVYKTTIWQYKQNQKLFILVYLKMLVTEWSMKLIFIIKHSQPLAEHTIKIRLVIYCPNIGIETIFMNTWNSKANETDKFAFNVSQRLDLRNSNKHIDLQKLAIYSTWKIYNITKTVNWKIIIPTWNDEFELADSSYSASDIKDYFECIIK